MSRQIKLRKGKAVSINTNVKGDKATHYFIGAQHICLELENTEDDKIWIQVPPKDGEDADVTGIFCQYNKDIKNMISINVAGSFSSQKDMPIVRVFIPESKEVATRVDFGSIRIGNIRPMNWDKLSVCVADGVPHPRSLKVLSAIGVTPAKEIDITLDSCKEPIFYHLDNKGCKKLSINYECE